MARRPTGNLEVKLAEPLLGLTRCCETICAAGCCGIDAFEIDAKHIGPWVRQRGLEAAWTALDQLADLARRAERHGGQVSSTDDFNEWWAEPSGFVAVLSRWRRATVRAVEAVTGRAIAINPRWRTSTVRQLARGIRDEGAVDRLPILADALQDAGCENPDILTHLRGGGPHARGCWVVDLLLGKA